MALAWLRGTMVAKAVVVDQNGETFVLEDLVLPPMTVPEASRTTVDSQYGKVKLHLVY